MAGLVLLVTRWIVAAVLTLLLLAFAGLSR